MIKTCAGKIAAVLCVVLLLAPAVVYAGNTGTTSSGTTGSNTKGEIDKAETQERELQQQLEAVQATINALKNDIDDANEYLDRLDRELDVITGKILDLNQRIDKKNDEIAVTTAELQAAQLQQEEQYAAMKLRIKYMYENSRVSYFELMLASSGISDILHQAEYFAQITKYDRNKLEEYIDIKNRIAAYKVQLEEEERDLEGLKREAEGEQQAVELLVTAKNQEMKDMELDKKAYEAKQKEIEEDIKELDNLIANLTKQYNAEQLAKANAVATQGNLYSGKLLLWPCPSSYRITSEFSPNRLDPVLGYVRAHKGTDIGAPTGTPVIAAASGLVTAAGYSSSMGNYIVISHGDGITTRYYHNSSLAVSAGQAVAAGQVISYVGATGWVTGPHLHFEVRINDEAVDAMQFY